MWYETVGEPKDEESEGGGTEGYVSPREGAPKVTPPGLKDVGGLVRLLVRLRLAAPGDVMGENGNGESDEDEGEWDSGVLPSEKLLLPARRT